MNESLLSDLEVAHTKVRDCLKPLVESLIAEARGPGGLTQYGYEISRSIIAELE